MVQGNYVEIGDEWKKDYPTVFAPCALFVHRFYPVIKYVFGVRQLNPLNCQSS